MTRPGQTGAFILALAMMLGLAVALQVVRDRVFARAAVDKQVLYVSDADVMRRAALSYDAVLADVYWIRALQHYGGERQKPGRERRYDLLYPLLDLATAAYPANRSRVVETSPAPRMIAIRRWPTPTRC
jgi:hypothetical protein